MEDYLVNENFSVLKNRFLNTHLYEKTFYKLYHDVGNNYVEVYSNKSKPALRLIFEGKIENTEELKQLLKFLQIE